MRGLGTSTLKRIAALPDLPPIADVLPGFEVLTWQGIVAPAGTPVDIINRLNGDLIKALKNPEFEARLRDMGLELYGTTPEQFAKLIRDDNAKWSKVIKATGARDDIARSARRIGVDQAYRLGGISLRVAVCGNTGGQQGQRQGCKRTHGENSSLLIF